MRTPKDLYILADYLDTLEKVDTINLSAEEAVGKFCIRDWVFKCGTPACAAGYAVKLFPKTFYFKNKNSIRVHNYIAFVPNPIKSFAVGFGITYAHAEGICMPSNYNGLPTPQEVADRIRKIADCYE